MGVTREWGSLNLEALPEVPRVVKYGLAPGWEHDIQLPRDCTGGVEDTRPGTAQTCREEAGEFMCTSLLKSVWGSRRANWVLNGAVWGPCGGQFWSFNRGDLHVTSISA